MTPEHHHQETALEDSLQRIKSEIQQGEQELQMGHQKEGEAILWHALSSATDLKDPKIATKILELLSGRGAKH